MKDQVRLFEETMTAFSVIKKEFFDPKKDTTSVYVNLVRP